jgi:Na+/H+ antiporter NhaD/arsenite permease-like protein
VELKISPIPFVISQTIAGILGGASTLIGDPSNLMIGSAARLSFLDFIVNITFFVAFLVLVGAGVIYLFFRKELVVTNERRARVMEFNEKTLITDKGLLIYGGVVFAVFIGLLIFQEKLGLHAATIALFSAILLLFKAKTINIEHFINNDIDWNTILFFCGLFTMVGALEKTGFIGILSDRIIELTHGNIRLTAVSLLWTTGIAAAFLDNVPFAAATIPVVDNITANLSPTEASPIWWSFVLGACLGGTGTLIGCTANIVAVGIAKKSGYAISFWTFTKYGALITLVNLVFTTLFILLRYF